MSPVTPPRALLAALDAALARPPGTRLEDAQFNALATAAFAWQFERNRPYAAYCERRGRTPDRVTSWLDIPAVPTAAFKHAVLVAGRAADAEAVFRTSGTTRGEQRRGSHYVLDLSLYHCSLLPAFAAMVLPDGARLAMFSLVPPPRDLPDSSLAHMIATVMEQLGSRRSGWFASTAHGIAGDTLDEALHEAQRAGEPVCLLGTASAFVHWTDELLAKQRRYRLPAGSRLMDTGGFKGRGRDVGEDALRALYLERCAIPPTHCVNEYGMTELCSQFYDSTLFERVRSGAAGNRRKLAPPWVRTLVVDPETLEPLPAGATGLLRHVDLANLGSVLAVQTEDMGILVDDGFRVLGRAAGAEPRGCSLAMDELLLALQERGMQTTAQAEGRA